MVALLMPSGLRGAIVVKDGEAVAFLGDSITQAGWSNPGGYVRLVVKGLEANGVKITPIPAGIGGHKSNQMLERLKRDVLDKKPTWMTLSCGVNDVWHGERGVPLEQYKANITAILDECRKAGVKVVVLTATVIGEDLENDTNAKLAAYNDFLRFIARERGCLLADVSRLFQDAIRGGNGSGRHLTTDGVHMNPSGDQLMAVGVLGALGLERDHLERARAAWQEIPDGAAIQASFVAGRGQTIRATRRVSLRDYERLLAVARQRGTNLQELANGLLAEEVRALLRPKGNYDSYEALFREMKPGEIGKVMEERLARRLEEVLKGGGQ